MRGMRRGKGGREKDGREEGREEGTSARHSRRVHLLASEEKGKEEKEGREEEKEGTRRAVGLLHIRFACTRVERSCHSASAHL